jgi:putative DNA primase/helicase
MTSNFDAAREWMSKGYNVVPLKAVDAKHPGVKWKGLQTRLATADEVTRWKPLFSNGVGFITGAISGVVVIETDGLAGETVLAEFEHEHGPLPDTLVVRSGSHRGFHRHYRHPGHRVKTTANENIKVDVRGDGGFCVLPPSPHKSGRVYEVMCDAEPAQLPDGLLAFIATKAAEAEGASPRPLDAVIASDAPAFESGEKLGDNTTRTPPDVEMMREALRHLADRNCFQHRSGVLKDANGCIDRVGWIEAGMALKAAYGDEVGFELWSATHTDDQARVDAPAQWASFDKDAQPGHVTIGSVIKAAHDAGFRFAPAASTIPRGFVSHGPFTMSSTDGLTKHKKGKNGVLVSDWISAPFEVLGACRDPNGRLWGKQLRFRDADNRVHTHHVQDAALHGDPGVLCATLASDGLTICRSAHRDIAEYLSGAIVDTRLTMVTRTGWHDIGGQPAFVLPSKTFTSGASERVELDGSVQGPYDARGSVEAWKLGVGTLAKGQSLPMFMISAALAGPLMDLVGAEGGGVHIFGGSSIGKSAMLQAAASVWGRGATPGYVRSWRATANGLEGAAASATDTCLVLDEIGVGEARDVAAAVYSLANGVGKARAARDGSSREPRSWRIFLLSSGELPVESKLGEDRGRKTRAGQLVRLMDIPADRGFGHGAFDNPGGYSHAGGLADAIKDAAVSAYGTAGPEFVQRIVADGLAGITDVAKAFTKAFVDRVIKPDASEQVKRVAKKFALIACAGELAITYGIAPWTRGQARSAAIWAFNQWLERRGGGGAHEEQQAIEQVRLLVEQHGEARFERVEDYGIMEEDKVRDRLGWRRGEGSDREWWVPPQVWKEVICEGLDPTSVARTLHAHGMLRKQGDKHWQAVVRIGNASRRAYVLTAAILDGGEDEP